MPIPAAIAFVFGLIYGSFLNVLLWRLPEGRGINGRSECRSCRRTLAWYDLVPVFSFIALKGKCRYCKAPIHPRYPLVELSTAAVLGLYFALVQPVPGLEAAMAVAILLVFVTLFFFDLFYYILPDVIVLPAIAACAIYDILARPDPLVYAASALLSAAFFAILYGASRGKKMGFGDVKLAFLIGLFLGYPTGFISIVGGIWLGALAALILLAFKKVTLKDALPLGAFLTFAAVACIIFSHELLPLTRFFQ